MDTEIGEHYSTGRLRQRIEAGLEQMDSEVTVASLGTVDEFHVGGRSATKFLVAQLGLTPDDRVLDVGSGLGGLARYIASSVGVEVIGVDLTAEYVEVARWLTELVGLDDRVSFLHGSAADLNDHLADATASFSSPAPAFSAATMLHVGMNIADKPAVFSQIASQLRSGGQFAIYDVMAPGSSQPDFPVPWAATEATSFVESPERYMEHLQHAGFTVLEVIDRTKTALQGLTRQASDTQSGPAALGLHLVMGPDIGTKVGNLGAAMRSGVLAPTVIRAAL